MRVKKRFSIDDVLDFNKTIYDTNAIHQRKDAAVRSGFEDPIVPGVLISGLFGGMLGRISGTILLGVNMKFIKPVYINRWIAAEVKKIHERTDKPITTWECTIKDESGNLLVEGNMVTIFKRNEDDENDDLG